MNVELHVLSQVASGLGSAPLKVRLLVDGEELLPSATPLQIAPTITPSASGASDKLTFSLSNLRLPALPEGSEREIVLDVGSPFLDSSYAFVWGASEVPAGVAINPLKLTKPTLRRP